MAELSSQEASEILAKMTTESGRWSRELEKCLSDVLEGKPGALDKAIRLARQREEFLLSGLDWEESAD